MHILWTNHAHKTRVNSSKLKVDHYAFGKTNDESNRDNKRTTVCSTVVFSTETSEAGTVPATTRCSAFRFTAGLWWVPMFGPRNGEDKVCPDGVRGAREDLKWDCDLGGRGWLAGQAVTNSSVERFRLGERLETLWDALPLRYMSASAFRCRRPGRPRCSRARRRARPLRTRRWQSHQGAGRGRRLLCRCVVS